MSNTQKPTGGTFSLDAYRKKAEKDAEKAGPFVLTVTADQSITIPWPNSTQMFEAEEAMQGGSSRGLIEAICGEQAEEILDLFGNENFKVLGAFGEDLQKHFKIGQ